MFNKILKVVKRVCVKLFGSKVDEIYWRFRHIHDKTWTKSYISERSMKSPERKILIDRISNCIPFESILEFGCASGPNLYLLTRKFPKAKIYGIDISKKAIKEGRKFFKKMGINNIELIWGGAKTLRKFSDKSIDIIFSSAVLIYFDPKEIKKIIKEMVRVAKKNIILLEFHHLDKSVYYDNWIHNYQDLFFNFVSEERIRISKIPQGPWSANWKKYGHIIEVSL